MQRNGSRIANNDKQNAKVRRRQIASRFIGPFDQTNAISREVFFQACLKILFRMSESIEIKVIQV